MTTSAQRQKTPRDPTSGIAGVRGEDLRFRPLAGALRVFPADGREKKGANMARKAAQNLAAAQEEAEGSEAGSRLAALLWLRLRETLLLQLRAEQDAEGQAEVRVFEVAAEHLRDMGEAVQQRRAVQIESRCRSRDGKVVVEIDAQRLQIETCETSRRAP